MKANQETLALNRQIAETLLPKYEPSASILPKIAETINKYDKFLLTTHVNADADGIGSQVGLHFLLNSLGKESIILNNEPLPEYLKQVMPAEKVLDINQFAQDRAKALANIKDYFVFILDSSELKRSAQVAELFQEANLNWATIDHHVLEAEPNFFVDANYGATAEIVWDLYRHMQITIPSEAAAPLYAGIVADTGNFRYPKTSLRTHLAGGDLLSFDINSDFIYRSLYESSPIDRLPYLARILSQAEINRELGYVLGRVRLKTREGLELGDSANEGIVNMLLAVKGVNIAGLITETEEGEAKCSLRSIGNFDVQSIAKKFGGGGHKNASGLKVFEPYETAAEKINKEIENYLKSLS